MTPHDPETTQSENLLDSPRSPESSIVDENMVTTSNLSNKVGKKNFGYRSLIALMADGRDDSNKKLRRNNHAAWEVLMKNKLLRKNNWDIIDKPDSPYRYDENGQYTRHPSSRQKRQLARIYGTLCASLSPDMEELRQEFEDKDTHKLRDPHALWRYLQTVTNAETPGEIALLMASAYNIQSDIPSEVHDTIAAIQLKLRAVGEPMKDAQ
jgi:hypothetical protein